MAISFGSGVKIIGANIGGPIACGPIITTVTSLGSTATVVFSDGALRGYPPIKYYTVVSSPGNITTSTTTNSVVIPGLTTGTSYQFNVIGNTAFGPTQTGASSTSVLITTAPIPVTYVVVAGGGGGGCSSVAYPGYGGGGGAGGFIYSTSNFTLSTSYPIVVGAGGAICTNGSYSKFACVLAYGGGAGGAVSSLVAGSGGSGGGGSYNTATSFGNAAGSNVCGQGHYGNSSGLNPCAGGVRGAGGGGGAGGGYCNTYMNHSFGGLGAYTILGPAFEFVKWLGGGGAGAAGGTNRIPGGSCVGGTFQAPLGGFSGSGNSGSGGAGGVGGTAPGGCGGSGVVVIAVPNPHSATFSPGVTYTSSTNSASIIYTVKGTATLNENITFT